VEGGQYRPVGEKEIERLVQKPALDKEILADQEEVEDGEEKPKHKLI
jgi:hypothetical protein